MAVLRSIQILQEKNTNDPNAVTSLSLTHKALSDISCLAEFKNLERLDLSFNNLTSLEGLKSCQSLKWLSVANNKLESLKGIEMLTNIMVLNGGKNKLKSMSEVRSLVGLRALILNDNDIVSICTLDQMKDLNTLVLSRNPICEIGESLAKAKSMTKLSLSNCQLQTIGSSLRSCTELKELRLAHNDIKTLPGELVHNRKLQNLDVGNNLITKGSDLKVLTSLIYLKTLNLQGNPIAEKESLAKKVKKMLPNLQVFNTKLTEKGNKKESNDLEISPDNKCKPGRQKDRDLDASSAPKKSRKHLLGDQSTDTLMSNSRDEEVKASSSKKQKRNEQLYKEQSDQMETSVVNSQSKKKLKRLQDNEINISENVEIPGEVPDLKIETKRKKDKTGKLIKDKSLGTDGNTDSSEKSLEKKSKGKVKSRESNILDDDKMALNDDESIDKKSLQNIDANAVDDKRKGKLKKKGLAVEALLFSPDAEVGLGGPSTWDA